MPQLLQPAYTTQKYDLPSTAASEDKAWVVLRKGKLTGGESLLIADVNNKLDFGMRILAERIQEWNFEADGQTVPINEANVRLMEPEDLTFLLTEIGPSLRKSSELDDPKKNELSSAT